MKVVFRLEANMSVGMGHASRCLGLAQELLLRGHGVSLISLTSNKEMLLGWFAEQVEYPKSLRIVLNNGVGLPGGSEDLRLTDREVHVADWLVIDNYTLNDDYLRDVNRGAARSMVFFDGLSCLLECDIAINQNFFSFDRSRFTTRASSTLLGPRFFQAQKKLRSLVGKKPPKNSKAILVSMGGADANNVGLEICKKLVSKIPDDVSVTLAFSGDNEDWPKALELQKYCPQFYALKRPEMSSIISKFSWAICAGGVTLLEAAAVGISCSVIITAENQCIGANSLDDLGGAEVARDVDEAVAQTLRRINEPSLHKKIVDRAMTLVDCRGPMRVADSMENPTTFAFK